MSQNSEMSPVRQAFVVNFYRMPRRLCYHLYRNYRENCTQSINICV